MPRIISFENVDPNKYNENPLKPIVKWFENMDMFSKSTLVIAVLLIVSTPFITSGYFSLNQNAQVKEKDLTLHNIAIISPTNNAFLTPNSTEQIVIKTLDKIKINKVEVYINGKLNCSINANSESAYTCEWKISSLKNTRYTITAIAYEDQNKIHSDSVDVMTE